MPSNYKKISIFSIVLITSFFFWLFTEQWISNDALFGEYLVWLIPAWGLLVLMTVMGLGFMLLRTWRDSLLLSFISGFLFLFFFKATLYNILALAILLLLHSYAIYNIHQEMRERARINLRVVLGRGMWAIIMPFMIMASFAYFATPKVQESARAGQLPPNVQNVIRTVVSQVVLRQLGDVPQAQRRQVENSIFQQTVGQLTSTFKPYFRFVPPIIAFGLFIILQGVSFIFIWLAILLGLIVFKLLRSVGFVNITEKSIKAEILSI